MCLKLNLIAFLLTLSFTGFAQKDSLQFTPEIFQREAGIAEPDEGKIGFKTLFSPTGDTIITFQGHGNEFGDFTVEKRHGINLKPFNMLEIAVEKRHDSIIYNYPTD